MTKLEKFALVLMILSAPVISKFIFTMESYGINLLRLTVFFVAAIIFVFFAKND